MLFANLVLITFVNSFFVKSTVNINPVHKLLQSISAKSISFMTNIILIRFIQKNYHSHPMSLNTSTKAECIVFGWWNSNEQDKISRSFFLVIDLLLLLGHLFWILVLRHTCKSPLENNKQYNDSITLLFNLKFIFSIHLVRWPIIYLQQNYF